jgi:hypothetical protein
MQTPQLTRTPYILCDQQSAKKFVVPIYQRLFVWGEIQIKTLLDDLLTAMKSSMIPLPYYVGVITVVEKNNQWEIVDGQQRLTFLTLFGCECLRRRWMDEWKTFIYFDNGDATPNKSKTLRIHYFGRKEDETDIEYMLLDAPDWSIAQVKNANFRLFHDCFESVMRSFGSDEERKHFVQYVFQNASFLISELPSTYSPLDLNMFFEKMNAAGRQLEPVEIVKGKYFSAYAATWDECLNFDNEFKDETTDSKEAGEGQTQCIIDIINDKISPVNEGADEFKDVSYNRLLMKPAVFLLHVLKLAVDPDSVGVAILRDPTRLVGTFADHVPSVDRKTFVEKFLAKMNEYRTWLDQNIIYLKPSADGSFEYLFLNEKPDTAEENAMGADSKVSGDASNDRMMKQFQSMLYVSSSDFQEWVLAMFTKCNNGQATFDLKTLKAWDNDKQDYIGSKNWDYWTINRYWFWKLDYILWEKVYNGESLGCDLSPLEKKAIEKYVFRRNRSIEHLHPQASVNVSWKDALHGFGNLAMISVGFNSQQSDDPFDTKYGRMTSKIKVGDLESIKLLLMFKKAQGQDENWTPEVAQKHAEEMHKILESYYQGND